MKKTIKKRAFISAIAMLIVSAIVLTSSTYAWFSMAKRVEVTGMDLNITAPDGVQISANTSAWTTTLTKDDIDPEHAEVQPVTTRWKAYEGHKNVFPEYLSPSSTDGAVANSLPAFFSGSIDDNKKLNVTKVADDTAGGYVAFDIFVKVAADQKVFFGDTKVTCADNPDVLTAMRVMLVNCGTVAEKTTDAVTIQGVKPPNAAQNRVVLYEIDAKNHTDASGAQDGTPVATNYIFKAVPNRDPSGANSNITAEGQYAHPFFADAQTNEDTAGTNAFINAVAGVNRVRVYLWMEGNDVDCANDVAGATINFNLVLTIA